MTRTIAILFTPFLLTGCVATSPPSPFDPSIHRPDFLAPFGVARVKGRSDVVTVPDNVEHVLYPNNSTARRQAHSISAAEPTLRLETSSILDDIAIQTTAAPVALSESARHSTDEIRLAWQKFCKLDTAITETEWTILESTSIPADISAEWDLRCRPAK